MTQINKGESFVNDGRQHPWCQWKFPHLRESLTPGERFIHVVRWTVCKHATTPSTNCILWKQMVAGKTTNHQGNRGYEVSKENIVTFFEPTSLDCLLPHVCPCLACVECP